MFNIFLIRISFIAARPNYHRMFIGTWSGALNDTNDDGMLVEIVGGDGGQSTFKV